MEFKNLTGQKFSNLTVLERVENNSFGAAQFRCLCDCGIEVIAKGSDMSSLRKKSCGCISWASKKSTYLNHPVYRAWQAMKSRCNTPTDKRYKMYGARGVTYCLEWQKFDNFFNWSMSNGWKSGLHLDKDIIAKKLNLPANLYSPDRCMWVTRLENNRNTSRIKLTMEKVNEIRKSKLSPEELMKIYGVNRSTISVVRNYKSWNK